MHINELLRKVNYFIYEDCVYHKDRSERILFMTPEKLREALCGLTSRGIMIMDGDMVFALAQPKNVK